MLECVEKKNSGWNNENKFPQKEPSNVVYKEVLEM
jgi:hypothetical protein